jgi:hypothetical protein
VTDTISSNPTPALYERGVWISRAQEGMLYAAALLLLILSCNQQSYAPKQGIHTVVRVTLADIATWLAALALILPALERCRAGRWLSTILAPIWLVGSVMLSHHGHDIVKVLHQGLHSSHLKGAVLGGGLLVLAAWQTYRLVTNPRPTVAFPPQARATDTFLPLPSIPGAVWTLLAASVLSGITMVLPTESFGQLMHSPDGQEALRRGARFMAVLRTPGRVRLAVRALALGAFMSIGFALWQQVLLHRAMHAGQPAGSGMTPIDVGGLMQSRNLHGAVLCVALPLVLGSLLGARRKVVKAGCAALIALGLLSMLSGAAFWSCVIGLVIAGAASRRKEGLLAAVGCMVLAGLVLAASPMSRTQVAREFFKYRTTYVIPKDYGETTAGAETTAESASGGVEVQAPSSTSSGAQTQDDVIILPGQSGAPAASKTGATKPPSSGATSSSDDQIILPNNPPAPAPKTSTSGGTSSGDDQIILPNNSPAPASASNSSPVTAGAPGDAMITTGPVIKKEFIEWVAGINMARDHMWMGVGPGQYQLNIGQYYGQDPNPAIRLEKDGNSLYCVYLASLGLIGLIPLLQIILGGWAQSWRAVRRAGSTADAAIQSPSEWGRWWLGSEGSALAAGLLGSWTAFVLVEFFTSTFVRAAGIQFAFLVALAASISMRQARSDS